MSFYIIPLERVGNARGPKYFSWRDSPAGIQTNFSLQPYGDEDVAIIFAELTTPEHDALVLNTDVIGVPSNLDNTLGAAAVTKAQTVLESLKLPSEWVNTSLTFREVLKALLIMFQIAQRFNGIGGGKLLNTDALDTTYASLSTAKKAKLQEMATSMGLDTSGLTGASTMRQVLQTLRSQLSTLTITFGSVEF